MSIFIIYMTQFTHTIQPSIYPYVRVRSLEPKVRSWMSSDKRI